MKSKIKKIEIIGIIKDKLNANHDIIVELNDSKRYIATFFTILNIQYLMKYYRHSSGECNNGAFFWASDMCIIEVFDDKILREAITSMIDEQYFDKVFKHIVP